MGDSTFKHILVCWWLLPVHLLSVTLLSLVLTQYLQNSNVVIAHNGDQNPGSSFRLSQPDVVALISFVLTLIRTMAGTIITLIGWRMAFYSLADKPTSLSNFDSMVSWRLPHQNGHLFLWFIFLFSIPAQLSAPIIQGALSWVPDIEYIPAGVIAITTAGRNAPPWRWHNLYSNSRFFEVMRAVGVASLAGPEMFRAFDILSPVPSVPSHLLVESLPSLQLGTKITNISMPIFQINSMKWATTVADLGEDVDMLDEVISSYNCDSLVFSGWVSGYSDSNLFRIATEDARLVIVNTEGWRPAPLDNTTGLYEWPVSSVVTRMAWVVVGLDFHKNCTPSPGLGEVGNIYKRLNDDTPSCYIFAQIAYTAGVFFCEDCVISTDSVIEAASNITKNQVVQPHPLTETVISMMPELLFYTAVANSSLAPTWHNLNGYVQGSLATAYQAGWNSLVNTFGASNPDPADISGILTPVNVLRADITTWRIWLWLFLNALLTAAALILIALQWSSGTDMVYRPALTAMLLSPNSFYRTIDGDGNTSDIPKTTTLSKAELSKKLMSEKDVNGRLHLRAHNAGDRELVKENSGLYRRVPLTQSNELSYIEEDFETGYR